MSRLHTTAGPLTWGSEAYPVPRPRRSETGELVYDGLAYAVHEGYRPLFLDLRLPAEQTGPTPVVVWIHGGGWVHGSRRRQSPNIDDHRVLESITAAGYAVAVIDYRLILEAAFPAALLDVRDAVDWLHLHADHFGLDRTRIALWGESAGAHLAMMATWCDDATLLGSSTVPSVAAVVEWYGPSRMVGHSGFADDRSGETTGYVTNPMVNIISGSGWSAEQLSPLTWTSAARCPVFIAHGRHDELSVADSVELHAALRTYGVDTELLVVDGGHVFVGSDTIDDVVACSIDFLDRVMPTSTVALDATEVESADGMGPTLRVAEFAIEGPNRPIRARITEPETFGGGVVLHVCGSQQEHAAMIAEGTSSVVVELDLSSSEDNPGLVAGDVVAAAEWIRTHAHEFLVDPVQLVLAADGAGAALAVAAALDCAVEEIPVQALFLLSPITDPALAGPLESLPTTIMTTGGCDHLDFRFARRLREAGVPVLHRVERPGSSAAQVISAITDDLDRFLRRSRSRYGEPAAQTWSEREAMVAESRR
ncbi:alpha/beta hydrolase [Rhodococcus sp. NCIMB 12038]|uniref:alpha/beta hydrolase n=1 Tax=Rhodococcus sp. NCIMB 12038 TaxID=933800 RepID=UPI000B3D0569|nr:alpha/beta hydrolase [Rhodococcus sp. NCIMB 12038]OUS92585.1 hypothetical protein CA951_27690 [Rhodococcus sp. NCIMB 12038]